MKITILGAGAFGLALASIFKENKNSVTVWSRFEEEVILLRKNNTNEKIKNIKLPEDIKYTSDLNLAIENSEIVVIAIPAQFVDNLVKQLKPIIKKQYILIASKGIENDTFSFLEEVVRRGINTRKIAVISGPTFAVDIANKYPVGFTLASRSWMTREVIKKTLVNSHVKVRASRDVVGVEVCGSIKNVISIAAGMIEGMNYPESTKAMFITESLHDLKNLIKALGGNKKTILTFAGFGDLLMTATSTKSRNFTFGKMLGENKPKEEIEKYRKETTIEGLYTLESIYKLIKKKKVYITYSILPEKTKITIKDEGNGFDWRSHLEADFEAGLHGMGIKLSQTLVKNLRYNNIGNEVSFEVNNQRNIANLTPAILKSQQLLTFKHMQIVCRENEDSSDLFYISSGRYAVYVNNKLMSVLTPADIFIGEMAFLMNDRRSATVVSIGEGSLVKIPKMKFMQLIEEYPHYGIFLSRLLANRLARQSKITAQLKEEQENSK